MRYNILEYLENSTSLYPNKTAALDENNSCTYSELLEASQNAGGVISDYIDSCEPVAVMMEKSINSLCSFFGTVYAGGFYVLFNPELPEARLLQMKEVLDTKLIITDNETFPLAKKLFPNLDILLIEEIISRKADKPKLEKIRDFGLDTDPLYANFTSGSTGTPKAVVVSHRSVLDFIDTFTDIFGIDNSDIIGNQAPFDFDVSVKDIYSSVKKGATLVLIPKHLFSQPQKLQDFICDNGVTTLIWAVSALCLISTFHGLDYKIPERVKRVLFSGEVMPLKHLRSWMEHLPDTQFVNLYGPTEITCNCAYHIIDRSFDYPNGIPIGKHFPNERVFLLDSDNRLISDSDVIGEICVSGTALAIGYYSAPEQTEKSFVRNPCQSHYCERIYRTGDLGKLDNNGDLFFCGRTDFQIKHMGHRIELEEIEKVLNSYPGIERCCCLFDEEKDKLYCFYVGVPEKKELHAGLKKVLPIFMVPGAFRKLDEMPITKNGKIDRKQLMAGVKEKRK